MPNDGPGSNRQVPSAPASSVGGDRTIVTTFIANAEATIFAAIEAHASPRFAHPRHGRSASEENYFLSERRAQEVDRLFNEAIRMALHERRLRGGVQS